MEPDIVRRADGWNARKAIACDGKEYTYGELLHASAVCAGAVASELTSGDARVSPKPRSGDALSAEPRRGEGGRVAFLVAPGFDHVAWQWGIWRAGAVAVPLSAAQAPAEWDFIIEDAQAGVVIGDDQAGVLAAIAARRGARWLSSNRAAIALSAAPPRTQHSAPSTPHSALLLYTSGTTSRPKGVVLTHANLEAQMATLADAWGWRADDRILHVLPLNHVHGIVNVLGCALWSGACCEFLSPFDAARAWERLAAGGITLFMAVPTIYARLLAAFDVADGATRERWAAGRVGCA